MFNSHADGKSRIRHQQAVEGVFAILPCSMGLLTSMGVKIHRADGAIQIPHPFYTTNNATPLMGLMVSRLPPSPFT